MSASLFLKRESPFFRVFDSGKVPIVSSRPTRVLLEGVGPSLCYMTDLSAIRADQLEQIVALFAAASGLEPSVIRHEVVRDGLPIRASETKFATEDEAFL
jgi:hypothetical protein